MRTEPFDYYMAILEALDKHEWTQARLAEVSGVSEGTISGILTNKRKTSPGFDTVEALLNALGMELTVKDTTLIERINAHRDPDPDSDWKYGKDYGIMVALKEIERYQKDNEANNAS